MPLLTAKESLLGARASTGEIAPVFQAILDHVAARKAEAQQARAARIEALADCIMADCIVTADADALTLEYTTCESPIIPVCIVTGRLAGGELFLSAVAGPGQSVSQDTLAAFEMAARRRVEANAAARLAAAETDRLPVTIDPYDCETVIFESADGQKAGAR